MAPKKSSSSNPPSLKQSILGFTSTKRTASTGNANSKGKKQLVRAVSSATKSTSVDSSTSNTSVSDQGQIEFSSTEDEALNNDKIREKREKNVVSKKAIGKVKISSNASVNAGVFRSRAMAENVEVVDGSEGNYLDTQDTNGRWRKHYNAVRQKMGTTKPIHGQNQTKVHHILRVFDLSYQYGPCVGVTRLERWERAASLGLNPPKEVQEILLTKQGREQDEFSQTVFFGEV